MWGSDSLLAAGADQVTVGYNATVATGLNRNDRLQLTLPQNFTAEAWLFHPATPRNELIVWHGGHGQPFNGSWCHGILQAFVGAGYHVLGMSMPLVAPNPTTVTTPGGVFVDDHNDLTTLEAAGFPGLRVFIDPVVRGITAALALVPFTRVAMAGISGGGWTTHLAAAVDDRIRNSYPCAGGVPGDLRTGVIRDTGDYEQVEARPWHSIATWREIYALAAYTDRRSVQILNRDDTCCYEARGRENRIWSYESDVQMMLGDRGSFEVRIDATHEPAHVFSDDSIAFMLADMEEYR